MFSRCKNWTGSGKRGSGGDAGGREEGKDECRGGHVKSLPAAADSVLTGTPERLEGTAQRRCLDV